MRPCRGRLMVVGVLLIVLLATFTLVTAARPPPQPLCEVCTDDVVEGSDVEFSTVTTVIDEDGVGHWTVRLDLRTNASVDPSSVRSAADDALRGHWGEAIPQHLSVDVADDTAVLTYDVPRMAHTSAGGVLVADYFHSQGEDGRWYGVNADRVVVTGPEGTTLVRAPAEYRLNGSAIAIAGTYGDTFEQAISPGWYLTFAEGDGTRSQAISHIAVGVDVAQLKATDVPPTAVVPTILLAACLGMLARRRPGPSTVSRTRGVLAVVGVIGGLAVAASVTLGVDGATFLLLLSATVLAPLVALSIVGVAIQDVLLTGRFGPALGARWLVRSGLAVSALSLSAAPFVAGTLGPIATGYGSAIAVATPTLFVPLALTGRRLERRLLEASILLSPLLLTLGWAPYGSYSMMYAPAITAGWALLTAGIGSVAYAVGREWRSENPSQPSRQ